MKYLIPNTSGQTLYATLKEGEVILGASYTNYLLVITRDENYSDGESIAQVPVVVIDNERFTQLTVTTVGLTAPGAHTYKVYGQNSAVNTDPTSLLVVGLIEMGSIILTDDAEYFTPSISTIENDVRSRQ
jgi:hypothetical protein